MISKKALLFFLLLFQLNLSTAQGVCDSSYSVCDSISIDSIIITNFITTGDRIHFYISSDHDFIYAPSFVICPDNDSVAFINNNFFLTGIFGPSTVTIYYEFLNFSILTDSISGNIIIDNSNNAFENCSIYFSKSIAELALINKTIIENNIALFPNPVKDYLSIKLKNQNGTINSIKLLDFMGKEQEVRLCNSSIDLRNIIPGLYLISLELSNYKSVTKKIIIK